MTKQKSIEQLYQELAADYTAITGTRDFFDWVVYDALVLAVDNLGDDFVDEEFQDDYERQDVMALLLLIVEGKYGDMSLEEIESYVRHHLGLENDKALIQAKPNAA